MESGHIESGRWLEALFDHSLDGILLVNDDGRYVDANPAVCNLVGYTREEILTLSVWDMTPNTHEAAGREQWKEFISAGKLKGEYTMLTKDGSLVEIEFSAVANIRPGVHLSIIRNITERKRHENEIRKSEEILAKAQRIAHLGSWDLDVNTGQLHWSDEIFRIYGQTPQRFKTSYDAFLNGVHPDDREAVINAVKGAMSDKAPFDIDYRIILPDGTERIVHGQGEVTFDAQGKAERMTGTVLDITARRKTEEALRKSEERYELAISGSAAGLWDWNLLTNEVSFTPRFKELLGYDEGFCSKAGAFFSEILHPDDYEYTHEVLDLHFKREGPYEVEFRLRRKSGDYRWFQSHGQAQWDASGKVCRMVGSIVDIHERKLAEQKIREQAALLDQASDSILVRDLTGCVHYWSKSAERVHGWKFDEILNKPVQSFMIVDQQAFEASMRELLELGHWSGEMPVLHKDGHEVLVESRWSLLRDESGRPKSIFEINTDITEKKSLESQFMRIQRMESIGNMVGGIAHDLNNVLGPIILGVDLLKVRLTEPRDRDLLDMIEASGKHGVDVVRQILHFARGEKATRTQVDPEELIVEMQKIVSETLPKSIQVEVKKGQKPWPIIADRTQIHQVLLNLCINARDAMPQGGQLCISVSNKVIDRQFAAVVPGAKPGNYALFEVADTGEGIPSEIMDKIFDPFFTTKAKGIGTGLGLSTTLAIIRNHGGFVTVESKPGEGTVFKVAFPALIEEGRDIQAVTNSLPRGNGETILLIDDEAAIRSITGQTLEAFGYHVITANDGAHGVDQYAKNQDQIAAVITDMMMPVLDGVATIRVLKRMNPDVIIIAASGWSAKGMEEDAAAEGVHLFMHKPYTAELMLRTLDTAMQKQSRKSLGGIRPPPDSGNT